MSVPAVPMPLPDLLLLPVWRLPQGFRARVEGRGLGAAVLTRGRGTVNHSGRAVRVRAYCSCGHPVDDHLQRSGQCRSSDLDGRCNCQSVDVDEAE